MLAGGSRSTVLVAALALACSSASRANAADLPVDARGQSSARLHVPSPDWRDQVIYFLMIDRFADGDPRNNDQHAGEYDPADGAKFSGGDLAGLRDRLDYIRELGATAVWITPPVANQWWSEAARYGGYHGYWARDFQAVDAHFGSLRDYQTLSRALHGKGMYLIQDVVVNHVGNHFSYEGVGDPRTGYRRLPGRDGNSAPARMPFSLNDPRRLRDRAAAIYHWTPDITDFTDRDQELNWQLAGLDDLNTENPRVRDALREAYGYWIREVGVDGFRVDTAFYVPPAYFADFLGSQDRHRPGMRRVAAATGREDFHVFGEGFGLDRAFDDRNARKIDSYMRADGEAANTLLPGMINFPLYGTLGDVFARGRPTRELAWRIDNMMQVHAQPWLMPTFVDNHDVDRFLAAGDEAGLKQALLAIMTLPGIPTIYYGTEQGLRGQRDAMFAGGYRAARDHFDAQAPLYRYLRRAIALRREHRVLSRGTPLVLAANAATPGALAWRMDADGDSALVAFNSSDRTVLLENLATGLKPDHAWRTRFAIDGAAPKLVPDTQGRANLVLPPRSGFVWVAAPMPHAATPAAFQVEAPWLDADAPVQVADDFVLRGRAAPAANVHLVVDGDLEGAIRVRADAHGRWQATLDTRDMIDPDVIHSVVAWDAVAARASARHEFRVVRTWRTAIDASDPAGDDHGPHGRYRYPLDPGWSEHHPADLLGVKVWTSGGALRLQLKLRDVVATWNPANGFDHVAFTVYLQLPDGADGADQMPQQNATLPDGMQWHYRLRAHGWSNALTHASTASATHEGAPVMPAARIEADSLADTVTFTVPARALGGVRSLSGARLYVTTWDYDGGYRGLVPAGSASVFGGGNGKVDPLVMDASAVITLP